MHTNSHTESRMRFGLSQSQKGYAFCTAAMCLSVLTQPIYSSAHEAITIETVLQSIDNTVSIEERRFVDVDTNWNKTIANFVSVEPAKTLPERLGGAGLSWAYQLWTSTRVPQETNVILRGNWQSCLEEDGAYAERIYTHMVKGNVVFALHMGPHDEFALYKGKGPDDEAHEHEGKDNLLTPAFHVFDLNTWRGARTWTVPSLHLSVNVVAGGGSRAECDSFYVLVEKK